MTVETGYKHIVQTPGFYEGRPCIDNYKISVHDIAVRRSKNVVRINWQQCRKDS